MQSEVPAGAPFQPGRSFGYCYKQPTGTPAFSLSHITQWLTTTPNDPAVDTAATKHRRWSNQNSWSKWSTVGLSLSLSLLSLSISLCLYLGLASEGLSVVCHHSFSSSLRAPTSSSLLNTHEISYPHPTPTPLHHAQDPCQSIAAYKFCCQSINLKMAIRAETCSWYLCNKQHISNHQIVVYDSWLIQL